MKVLVSGASGFVGANMIKVLRGLHYQSGDAAPMDSLW